MGDGGSRRGVRSTNCEALRSVAESPSDTRYQRVGLREHSPSDDAADAEPADRLGPCGSASIAQHQLTWNEILTRARLAEDAGLDGIWVFDHLKALYGDPKGPSMEGWTLLAGLARETSRVRLGTLVTGMTYRHPSMLAAEVVTVDHLSNGRVECAVGAAWNEPEPPVVRSPYVTASALSRVLSYSSRIRVRRNTW
jgi:Luciferase-like monooxygenase